MNLASLALKEYTAGFTGVLDSQATANKTDGMAAKTTKRRCRTREQGIALMTVGHAIEYLVHSRLVKEENTSGAEREALAILLNANLSVYNEGTEIKPLASRFRRWFHGGASMEPTPANAQ